MLNKISLLTILAVILCACQSPLEKKQTIIDEQEPEQVHLPLGRHRWQCDRGEKIETQLRDHQEKKLTLTYQGKKYHLQKQESTRPVIYQNATLAFFSDGRHAVIGAPYSDNVLVTGCRLQE